MFGWTVDDGEAATDEVILDIDNDQGGLGLDYSLDPVLVTVIELLDAHAAVSAGVEDVEHVRYPLRINSAEIKA